MDGTHQHYLPQFLQKGFTIKASGRARYTWLYRKRESPIEERIKEIGAEKFFYGDPSTEPSADDAITEIESPYAVLLDFLRASSAGLTRIVDPRVPSLIGHLAVRTKYVREAMLSAGNNLLRSLQKHFPDRERMRSMLLAPDQIDLVIEMRPDFRALSRVEQEKRRAMYRFSVNETLPNWPIWQEQLNAGVGMIIEQLPGALRERMNAGLAETPSPEAIAERYATYAWTVLESTETLILGDTACVVEGIDGAYRGFDNTDIPARNIFLPITSNLMLIGASGSLPALAAATLNEASARSAWEFFICAERSGEIDQLHGRIGQTSEILLKEQVEELAKATFLELMLRKFHGAKPALGS